MAVLDLCFCARSFSSCGKRGPLFIAVRGPLTIAASLVAEHRLRTRRLSNCGSWAQLLRGMWDLPRPGLEPVSPTLTGRLSTTAPPGKPRKPIFKYLSYRECGIWVFRRNPRVLGVILNIPTDLSALGSRLSPTSIRLWFITLKPFLSCDWIPESA